MDNKQRDKHLQIPLKESCRGHRTRAFSSIPSMKKLVTRVTGTVRIGPATGYMAKVLARHFGDAKDHIETIDIT